MGPRRVLLHFGPPKTGTSALQAWCARNREVLARHGVHYAAVDRADDPKHQWLLKELQTGRFDRLQTELTRIASGTLVLSCEGVMVHRGKIGPDHWAGFRAAVAGVERSLFLVQRETGPWVLSLWRQGVLNPPLGGRLNMPSLAAFSASPWLREMTALPDLAQRLARDSGADTTHIARFEEDWLHQFKTLADLPDDPQLSGLPMVHESPPEAFVQLYLALARSQGDVTDLRLALFAVYCRGFPTTNLTLQNTARKFAALRPDARTHHLQALIGDLGRHTARNADEAALANRLCDVATNWLFGP